MVPKNVDTAKSEIGFRPVVLWRNELDAQTMPETVRFIFYLHWVLQQVLRFQSRTTSIFSSSSETGARRCVVALSQPQATVSPSGWCDGGLTQHSHNRAHAPTTHSPYFKTRMRLADSPF